MLQMTPQNVGTAPGTTTFTIPQQPEMTPTRMSLDGGFQLGGALGTVYPTDFDLSRMYGYLPYNSGWISGKIIPGGDGKILSEAEAASMATMAPEQQLVALQAKLTAEEIATRRSDRRWTMIAGLVGVAGLVVSVIALRRS